MIITIGRDHANDQLIATVDGDPKPKLIAKKADRGVSGIHCRIDVDAQNNMFITNLKPRNVTYVNGLPVVSSPLKLTDKVTLGMYQFALPMAAIEKLLPQLPVDLRHLRPVWQHYNKEITKIQNRQQYIGIFRGVTVLVSPMCIAAGIAAKGGTIPIIVGIVGLIGLGLSFLNVGKSNKKKERLKQYLLKKYCCPSCGYYFNNIAYEVLEINFHGKKCPGCQKQIIAK